MATSSATAALENKWIGAYFWSLPFLSIIVHYFSLLNRSCPRQFPFLSFPVNIIRLPVTLILIPFGQLREHYFFLAAALLELFDRSVNAELLDCVKYVL